MKLTVNGKDISDMTFNDGQPHITLNGLGDGDATIRCRLASSDNLVKLMLVADTIAKTGRKINLEISYLLGARMDRQIDSMQPFTLEVVCKILNIVPFKSIKIFNVHSQVALDLLRAENILPHDQIKYIRTKNPGCVCVAPDKGSAIWIKQMISDDKIVECKKNRESQTGKLSGFIVLEPEKVANKTCLIIDDICDGGGTFKGIASELKKFGATKIILYVSHGIFAVGHTLVDSTENNYTLENIDEIYTTTSYRSNYPKNINILPEF